MNMQSGWLSQLAVQIRLFWSWWWTELDASIPAHWRRQLEARERRLTYSGDGFEVDQGGRLQSIASDELATDPVIRTWQTRDKGRCRLLVSLPPSQLLRQVVQLPAATEPRLGAVLGFELDRHTPFSTDTAGYGYRILRRDRAARRIDVELFVLPNTHRDRILAALKTAGLTPEWLLPEGCEQELHLRRTLNLLPASERPRQQGRYRWPLIILSLLVLLLAALFYLQDRHLQALQSGLGPLQQQAEVARTVQTEADRLEQGWRFLYDRRLAQPSRLLLLDELTRQLPDHTWVNRLELDDGELQLQGESTHASDLIALLEASPLLQSVSFTSPVTINPRSGKERFSVRARVSQEVQP